MEVEIKKEYKTPSGVYVLFGEEDYLKRFYAAKIREALLGDSPYALFNHVIFTPKNFTADAASGYTTLAGRFFSLSARGLRKHRKKYTTVNTRHTPAITPVLPRKSKKLSPRDVPMMMLGGRRTW